jgi:hypothetical protein
MDNLIKKTCMGISNETLGSEVDCGHYDIIKQPEEEIIIPQAWEFMLEPDQKFTIQMWSSYEKPSQSVDIYPPSEDFYLLPEADASTEDRYGHLPTLLDLLQRGQTTFSTAPSSIHKKKSKRKHHRRI